METESERVVSINNKSVFGGPTQKRQYRKRRDAMLLRLALSPQPLHIRAMYGEGTYNKSDAAVMAYHMMRYGELIRVSRGVYDLGEEAPEWTHLLRNALEEQMVTSILSWLAHTYPESLELALPRVAPELWKNLDDE